MIWSANRVLHVRGMKWVLNSLTWTIYITKNSQKKTPTLPIYRLTKYNKTPIMNLLEFSYCFCVFHHPKKTKQLRTPRKISPWPSSPVSKAYLHRSLDLGRVKSRSRGASKQLRWFGWGFLHPWKTGPNEFVPPKKGGGLFQLENTSEPTIDVQKTCSGSGEHLWLAVTNHGNRVCDCEIAYSVYKHLKS